MAESENYGNRLISRLQELFTSYELEEIVQAAETIINSRNGYGTVEFEFRKRRMVQISITSTIKPEKKGI